MHASSSDASGNSRSSHDGPDSQPDSLIEEQKRQSQKMEALGRLAGGVAHDFNNLLTAINGYADLLMSLLDKSDPNRELAEEIRKAGEKGSGLTRQLLSFSHKQSMEVKAQDMRPLLEDLQKLLARLLPTSVKLELSTAPEPMVAMVDRGLVEQALINLVVNARDAMEKGGKVQLSLQRQVIDPWPDQAPLKPAPGEYVALSVRDQGIGMPPEIQSHLFEPFYTTKSKGRGTGLGLSTVYGIVQQLDGGIQVESSPGAGSTFTLYFPASSQKVKAIPKEAEKEAPHGRGERLILVESDASIARMTRMVLEKSGYEVIEAAGMETLFSDPGFDGVILERTTFGQDGLDLGLSLLRQKACRTVILTGSEPMDLGSAIFVKGLVYVPKPFQPKQLLDALRTYLDG